MNYTLITNEIIAANNTNENKTNKHKIYETQKTTAENNVTQRFVSVQVVFMS